VVRRKCLGSYDRVNFMRVIDMCARQSKGGESVMTRDAKICAALLLLDDE